MSSQSYFVNSIYCLTDKGVGGGLPFEKKDLWFDADQYLGQKGHRYYSMPVKYALAATRMLGSIGTCSEEKSGIFLGTGTVDQDIRYDVINKINKGCDSPLGAASAPNMSANTVSTMIAQKINYKGPGYTFTGDNEVGLLSIWSSKKFIDTGQLCSAIIGQVEHQKNGHEDSGSILWSISSTRQSDNAIEIKEITLTRLFSGDKLTNLISIDDERSCCILSKGHFKTLKNMGFDFLDRFSRTFLINNNEIGSHRLDLMFNLTREILTNQWKSIVLISKNGHVLNIALNPHSE